MAIKSQIPKLKKNESAASFKARVKTWELRTGKKYPKPRSIGPLSDEQRILGGALTIGSLNKKDYSKGKEGEKWKDEVSDLALKELRIQKSADETEALQQKINADRRAGKLSNIPAPEEEPKSKILYGEDLMDVYGPYGAKYDKEDDGEFERPNTTKLQVARSLSTGGDPIPPDPGGKGGVSESKASSLGSTVHTRHYKTGERLGVMTRNQRRAYEKEAAGRTFESEVAKYEKSSGHGKSHLRETLYKRNLRRNKKKLSIED